MSSTRRNLIEADWDRHKVEIWRCFIKERCSVKELVEHLNGLGLHVTKSQMEYKLKQWKFRQHLNKQAWKFVGHRISKRTRDGKKSEVIFSGIRLLPDIVYKETMRNRSLPKLSQPSPSPEPPSDLPLAICSPAPIEVTFNLPQSLPWVEFQTQLRQMPTIPAASRYEHTRATEQLVHTLLHDDMHPFLTVSKPWTPQNIPTLAAYMSLAIPETSEGDNMARSELLTLGSGPERLRVILEVFIAKLSNNLVEWEEIERNWTLLKAAIEFLVDTALGKQLLQTQTMKAFLNQLHSKALDVRICAIDKEWLERHSHAVEVAHQIMIWILKAGHKIGTHLRRAVEVGDALQDTVRLLVEHGSDIFYLDRDGFSTLQLVLDEEAMAECTNTCPGVSALRNIFLEKATQTPNLSPKDGIDMLQYAIKHGDWYLTSYLIYDHGVDIQFWYRPEYGIITNVTAVTCAAQYIGTPQKSWEAWFEYILRLMELDGPDSLRRWPSQYLVDPLISAALEGNNDAIEYFVARGGSLDSENTWGIFPLLAAVAENQIHTCMRLIELGVDVNKTGPGGLMAMHVAAVMGEVDILRVLVESTTDKNSTFTARTRGFPVLFRLFPILPARDVSQDHLTTLEIARQPEVVKYLLKEGIPFSKGPFPMGRVPKHVERWLRDKELIEILVDAGQSICSHEKGQCRHCQLMNCILRNAVRDGDADLVTKLLRQGVRFEGDEIGLAAEYGHAELVTTLLRKGARLNGNELGIALREDDVRTAQVLREAGANLTTRSEEGKTFLEMAISGGHEYAILWALAADPGFYDPGALCAATYLALCTDDQSLCRSILQRRPDTSTANILEATAVAIAAEAAREVAGEAAEESTIEILQMLMSVIPHSGKCLLGNLGDNATTPWIVRYKDMYGCLPQWIGRGYLCGSPLTCVIGPGTQKILPLLVKRGYRPDITTLLSAITVGDLEQTKRILDGDLGDMIENNCAWYDCSTFVLTPCTADELPTPIQVAATHNNTKIVRYLVARGARPDEWQGTQHFELSPLQAAVKHENLEMLAVLLEAGAQPNDKPASRQGSTALQIAARNGCLAIAKILLDHDNPANVNARRALWEGQTALEAAAYNGRIDMVQLLLCNGAKTEGTGHRQYTRAVRLAIFADHHEIVEILQSHREWTEKDEQRYLNEVEGFWEISNVHDSECSDSECSFAHSYPFNDDESLASG
ncbi:ankyrin repeat-containing domain protein [Hypoxylon sp. FL1284]|nr:ankyrin repeat-containing domain protein [Hypoxylon sp. FL1284]